LRAIVARALAADPAERYADPLALARDVAAFRAGAPVSAHRENVLERVARWTRRYRLPILLVLGYLAARAIVALWIRQRPGP
jgi:hypothetical protein